MCKIHYCCRALNRYFWSFHHLVDLMVRVAVNEDAITKTLIGMIHPGIIQLPVIWLNLTDKAREVSSLLSAPLLPLG
jgi:hypothetical protein